MRLVKLEFSPTFPIVITKEETQCLDKLSLSMSAYNSATHSHADSHTPR